MLVLLQNKRGEEAAMAEMPFDELEAKARAVVRKYEGMPEAEVNATMDPADLEIVDQYLRRANTGVSPEMLDFISTPEQQTVTRAMFAGARV